MSPTETAARITPLLEQLAENEYARENLRKGAQSLQAAYERAQKRRVDKARDEKLHRQIGSAWGSLSEGARALASGRSKPKRVWPKRLAVAGAVGVAAAGVARAVRGGGSAQGAGE
ncbi:MAG TPA: hypothetical protein VFJ99_00590 [Solirubrobacterales bacterium]|nr:hypothetical protein [Solirubrobacterales bacterium]